MLESLNGWISLYLKTDIAQVFCVFLLKKSCFLYDFLHFFFLYKKDENKIKSPYTVERKSEKIYQNIIYVAIVVLLVTIGVLLYNIIVDRNEEEENLVYGGIYELTE